MLPLPLLYVLLSPLLSLLCSRFYRRQLVTENLRRAFPELSEKKRAVLRRDFYRHLGDLACESFRARTMPFAEIQERVDIQGLEVLDACTAEHRQVIYLGCHLANWELPAYALKVARPNLELTSLYRPLHNRALDRFFLESRKRVASKLIPDNISPREILRGREHSRLMMIFAEQRPWRKGNKLWTRLLGCDTPFHTSIEKLPRLLNGPVIFAAAHRSGRGRFVLSLKKLSEPPYPRGETGVLAQYAKALEDAIREQPAHWLWSMNIWKYPRQPHEPLLTAPAPR